MKRDMDLCRTLLLRVEETDGPLEPHHFQDRADPFFIVEGHSVDQVIYNFSLLRDAGFFALAAERLGPRSIMGLSWVGHEFLDTVRSPEVWTATKAVAKKAGGVGLDLLVQIAKAETKRFLVTHFGLPP